MGFALNRASRRSTEAERAVMSFDEVLDQVRDLLQERGRLGYRALKRRFALEDEFVEDIKHELIKAERVAVDEDGEVLVWTGGREAGAPSRSPSEPPPAPQAEPRTAEAERRQLTVMFCDLVGSTPMSAQLDPEEYREVMQAYQEMCGDVLAHFTGHIARYEGDGILVYFGYPVAQEDAAEQAVRAGLQILAGLPDLNARFQPRFAVLQQRPLQVRIGMHTGLSILATCFGDGPTCRLTISLALSSNRLSVGPSSRYADA